MVIKWNKFVYIVVILDNYYDGTKLEVMLDKRLSPAKNAEAYYKKYNKIYDMGYDYEKDI